MGETAGAVASGDREDLRRRQQQQHHEDEAEDEMREGGQRRRPSRHELHHGKGSLTTAFVALDYMFLLVFFGFLCFFFVQIWRGSSGGGGSFA